MVLGGFQTDCRALACFGDAQGINVVNVKFGGAHDDGRSPLDLCRHGLGAYRRSLYDKLFRLEYRIGF